LIIGNYQQLIIGIVNCYGYVMFEAKLIRFCSYLTFAVNDCKS